jgi:hypothetical protein
VPLTNIFVKNLRLAATPHLETIFDRDARRDTVLWTRRYDARGEGYRIGTAGAGGVQWVRWERTSRTPAMPRTASAIRVAASEDATSPCRIATPFSTVTLMRDT